MMGPSVQQPLRKSRPMHLIQGPIDPVLPRGKKGRGDI
jgi:hypothetical protein